MTSMVVVGEVSKGGARLATERRREMENGGGKSSVKVEDESILRGSGMGLACRSRCGRSVRATP